ncbi:MAG: DUF1343 domain-containing protein [Thermodesulfovibrionales bacterium]|nr:DUF1343 domain-containing protein [Thermodesulfovibrionales bacterium]
MVVKTGLDLFHVSLPKKYKGLKAGLLIHPASINRHFKHACQLLLNSTKIEIKAFFGPQHGIYGQTQDNMIEWHSFIDAKTGLPVFSLYGETRKPTDEMLKDIDVMIIDLQDIGARYYTFIWTMDLCMESCHKLGKSVIVLDRPNPITGIEIEGTVLDSNFKSFVGQKPLPIRHGMTIGEIGNYLKGLFYPQLDLFVIKMRGWKREMWFDETGLPWVMPSPNMPTLNTAIVYPGMCLLEGTIISEGRGTTRPFEIFGAPFIDPEKLIKRLKEFKLKGVLFRPLWFQPTFQKYAGELCGGAQLHILDRNSFKPFRTAVAIIKAIYDLYPKHTLWRPPPYEYEQVKKPFDILVGSNKLRSFIEQGVSLKIMEEWWLEQSFIFNRDIRKNFLLYG